MSYSGASGSKAFTKHAGPLTVMLLTRAPFEEMRMRMSGEEQGPQGLLLLLLPQAVTTRGDRANNQVYLFMIKSVSMRHPVCRWSPSRYIPQQHIPLPMRPFRRDNMYLRRQSTRIRRNHKYSLCSAAVPRFLRPDKYPYSHNHHHLSIPNQPDTTDHYSCIRTVPRYLTMS